ncbi:unnamed protein product [Symbiodinium natans]|uniref:Uncharacterized protein n=1 Tax=Symbiodinium natans TaxID=878477 RepID=A0A812G3V1_9DINO|nr:unnamed protein product [Symbiodinium natans]
MPCTTIIPARVHKPFQGFDFVPLRQTSSWFVRTISGISEGGRLALKAVFPDAPQRPPTKPKLISVGFARTGTTSFVTALKQLGYTPCHDNEVVEVASLLAKRFNDTHPMPVGDFLEEFGAQGFDVLFWFSYEIVEWVVQHPEVDIKFVLTSRDSGRKWAESWERIRNMIPRDKLLEFNMKEGWKPLCDFLGKPVPDTQFPHVNDRVVMRALLGTLSMITWVWPMLPLLLAYFVFAVLRHFRRFVTSGQDKSTVKKRQ